MSNFLWTSDIHLNFYEEGDIRNIADLIDAPLVISGDIAEGRSLEHLFGIFLENMDHPVYFVLGNHDFYHGSRGKIKSIAGNFPKAHYLSNLGIIKLTETIALIGSDGWYDCRGGDYDSNWMELSDFTLIKNLQNKSKDERLVIFQSWADEETINIIEKTEDALSEGFADIYVVTHVPPIGDDPYYTNYALGYSLKELCKKFPEQHVTVLAGHTHQSARKRISHNLEVYVASSDYKETIIRRIEL